MALRNVEEGLNIVNILRNSIEHSVKKVVADSIVEDYLKECEKELRKKIEPLVNELSFKYIKDVKDYIGMREELRVFLQWKNGENKDKNVKKII